jgi:hypothetical protein
MKKHALSTQEIMHLSHQDPLGPKQIEWEENVIPCKFHWNATYGSISPDQPCSFCLLINVFGTADLIWILFFPFPKSSYT